MNLTPPDTAIPRAEAPESPLRFEGINLLRAVAAALVVLYHVIVIGKWTDYPISGPWLLGRAGWIGVDLFLVISGFVIALAAIRGVSTQGDGFRLGFARRRLARIVPLYLLTGLVFLFVVDPSLLVLPAQHLFLHLGTHLSFLHNLLPTTHGSINGPNWSVALEMQFYLLVGLTAPWWVRRNPMLVALVLIVLAVAWRAGVVSVVGLGVERAHILHVYTSQLPGVLDAFGLGIGLAIVLTRPQRPRIFEPAWSSAAIWFLAFAILYWVTFEIYWPRAGYWDQWPMVVLWRTLLALTSVSLVAMVVTLPGSVHRAVWLAPWRYLGEISYGIYLWHLPVLLTVMALPGATGSRLLVLVMIGTLALASATWHMMERPMIERFR